MWTKREKYIENIDEICEYLNSMAKFHDYRIGSLHFEGIKAVIMIEEVKNVKVAEATRMIWDFLFDEIEHFEMDCDCVMPFYILEIVLEERKFIFNCDNGNITIKAREARIGIPSDVRGSE